MTEAALRGAPTGAGGPVGVAADIAAMNAALDGLNPADEAGRRALAEAERLYSGIGAARLTMALPPADPISFPLVLATLAWSCLLFCGLGALSRANASTVAALALGSIAGCERDLAQPRAGSAARRDVPALAGPDPASLDGDRPMSSSRTFLVGSALCVLAGEAAAQDFATSAQAMDYLAAALPRATAANPKYRTVKDGTVSQWLTQEVRFSGADPVRVEMRESYTQTKDGKTTPGTP